MPKEMLAQLMARLKNPVNVPKIPSFETMLKEIAIMEAVLNKIPMIQTN